MDKAASAPKLPANLVDVPDQELRWLADELTTYAKEHPDEARDRLAAVNDELARRLVEDDAEWDMPTIARELGVKWQTVRSWRNDCLERVRKEVGDQASTLTEAKARALGIPPHPNNLPLPNKFVFGKPIWRAGAVRRWAMQTGRMTPAGIPQKGKPPGRPRKAAA